MLQFWAFSSRIRFRRSGGISIRSVSVSRALFKMCKSTTLPISIGLCMKIHTPFFDAICLPLSQISTKATLTTHLWRCFSSANTGNELGHTCPKCAEEIVFWGILKKRLTHFSQTDIAFFEDIRILCCSHCNQGRLPTPILFSILWCLMGTVLLYRRGLCGP